TASTKTATGRLKGRPITVNCKTQRVTASARGTQHASLAAPAPICKLKRSKILRSRCGWNLSKSMRTTDGRTPPGDLATGGRIRPMILDQSKRANVGHIGSALSVADILAVLHGDLIRAAAPDQPDRDRLVLSKGHAALALYAALRCRGWLTDADLDSYCTDDTL